MSAARPGIKTPRRTHRETLAYQEGYDRGQRAHVIVERLYWLILGFIGGGALTFIFRAFT